MQIILFKSEPKQTPFAPEYEYIILETELAKINIHELANACLEKEKEYLSNYPLDRLDKEHPLMVLDGYTGLGKNSMTARYVFYNIFKWEDEIIKELLIEIKEQYLAFIEQMKIPRRKIWIRGWLNVMRDGEQIKIHLHNVSPYAYLGGHVCVQCTETSTFYVNPINQINEPYSYESPNVAGKLTFFQHNIPHYTSKHHGDLERITIAFDLMVDEAIEDYSEMVLFDDVLLQQIEK
jgi:hypothetical protein